MGAAASSSSPASKAAAAANGVERQHRHSTAEYVGKTEERAPRTSLRLPSMMMSQNNFKTSVRLSGRLRFSSSPPAYYTTAAAGGLGRRERTSKTLTENIIGAQRERAATADEDETATSRTFARRRGSTTVDGLVDAKIHVDDTSKEESSFWDIKKRGARFLSIGPHHQQPAKKEEGHTDEPPVRKTAGVGRRRKKIYTKVEMTLDDDAPQKELGPEVYTLISSALSDMFFLGSAMFAELKKVAGSFEQESFGEGVVVMKEGEEGDRMYVIESGAVKVFKAAEFEGGGQVQVGFGGRGDIVGELALLYGEARAATVIAEPGGVVAWSLTRDRFKTLAAVADARELSMRAVNLRAVPTLSNLSRRQVYLLARAMKTRRVAANAELAAQNQPMDSCFLVELGSIYVQLTTITDAAKEMLALRLALFPHGTETQAAVQEKDNCLICSQGTLVGASVLIEAARAEEQEASGTPAASKKTLPFNVRIVAGPQGLRGATLSVTQFLAQLGPVSKALKGEASVSDFFPGVSDDASGYYAGLDEDALKEHARPVWSPPTPGGGKRKISSGIFSRSPSTTSRATSTTGGRRDSSSCNKKSGTFCAADFNFFDLVGEGTYGAVWKATPKKEQEQPQTYYAIKQMSKKHVVNKAQLAHIHDERRLLVKVRHPNVVRLYGAFQDDRCVYLVTELVEGPDLWSVIYEPSVVGFLENQRLCDASDGLLKFYLACVVLALSKLHELGIVFRDLKPENLMLDTRGYLKLVDFGFAKQLPYYTSRIKSAVVVTPDSPVESESGTDREKQTDLAAHFKTYTMCGTSEYIAPEIINGSGHDWSADVWAAACVFYELYAGVTPFVEYEGESDNAAIFKRVLSSQFKPFIPPFKVAKRKQVASLIFAMLKFDPSERLSMANIMHTHKFFLDFDFEAVLQRTHNPEWTPPQRPPVASEDRRQIFENQRIEKFVGDQNLFANFDW